MKYVFDLDGTILETAVRTYDVIEPNEDMIRTINNLYDKENEIIIHTARHWNNLQRTIEQLRTHNVRYTTLVMGKPVADYYVDDKAMRPDEFVKLKMEDTDNE